ncbi:MAG: S49 family peptidase [Myxococcota bacterium]|nr:S49 family peptidase [Myxococcota bacterium]
MLSILFRIVFSPLFWIGLFGIQLLNKLALRNSGVLEVVLDGSKSQKHPLWFRALESAAAEPRIRAVHLKIESLGLGWAELQSLRDCIQRISKSGTPVVASMESGDTPSLFLASACDEIVLAPLGGVLLGGIGLQLKFFGEAMERLGLKFEVVSAGDYKSAAEPVSRAFASRPNREALQALVADLQAQLRAGIAEGRGVDENELQERMEEGILTSEQALDAGLVDALLYPKGLEKRLEERLGEKPRVVSAARFLKRLAWKRRYQTLFRKRPRVQVIHLEGAIVRDAPKWSRKSQISQEESLDVLEALIQRPPKAVVLVVDSPGGSALVSDLIWEAVGRLNQETPVVACFSNVAASGGYYLSAGCRAIVAQPMTLTGSIGVISGKLVTGGALAKFGVFSERVSGAAGTSLLGSDRPLSQQQRALLTHHVREIYAAFKKRVEDGRAMGADEVEAVAQGRVWSGQQAHKAQLVDELGGVAEALSRACELAEISLEEARLTYKKVERPKPLWTRFVGQSEAGLAMLVDRSLSAQAETLIQHPSEPLAIWPLHLHLD